MNWLASVAPLAALQLGCLGGQLWKKLKREDNLLPEWSKLAQAKFWSEEEWRDKRDILAGVKRPPQVFTEESVLEEEGTLEEQTVSLPSGAGKSIHWGPLGLLMEHVPPNVLWVEADDDEGVSPAVLKIMATHKEVHVLMTGTPVAVDKGTEQAINLGATHGCAASIISMFMSDDPAFGPRGSLDLCVEHRALLLTRTSCGQQREHLRYATMHTKWTPGMLLYLLEILGVQKDSTTMTFVPHFCRTDEEVLKMVGWITASIPGLHPSFVLQKGDMHPPMVHQFLKEVIENKVGTEETVHKQMMVLMDGLPVQSGDMSKTLKELVEERKQALKVAHLQAKSEFQEEQERESLQAAASQDVLLGTQSTLNVRSGSGNLELSQASRSGSHQAGKKAAVSTKKSGATSSRQKEVEAKRKAIELEEGPQSKKSKKPSREPAPKSKPMAQPMQASSRVQVPFRRPPVPPRGGKSLPDPAEEPRPVEDMELSLTMSEESETEEEGGSEPPSD